MVPSPMVSGSSRRSGAGSPPSGSCGMRGIRGVTFRFEPLTYIVAELGCHGAWPPSAKAVFIARTATVRFYTTSEWLIIVGVQHSCLVVPTPVVSGQRIHIRRAWPRPEQSYAHGAEIMGFR